MKGVGLAVVFGQPYYKPSFDYTAFPATRAAAASAYEQARVKPTDIDFAEVHDCFTITEIGGPAAVSCVSILGNSR